MISRIRSAAALSRTLFSLVIVAVLVACGGGGGGGGIITTPTASVTSVTVAPGTASVLVGQTTTLVASVATTGSAASTVNWSTSNAAVASIVASGNTVTVTGTGGGTATITATSTADASKSASATITVTAPQTVVLNPTSLSFTATQNGALPASRTVAVTASTGVINGLLATVSATSNGINWLNVTFTPTSTPSTFTMSVTSTALPPGTYTGTVTIGAPSLASSVVLNVSYVVSAQTVNQACVLANAPSISIGQIVNGALASATDCVLGSGKIADHFRLVVATTTVVQIDNVSGSGIDPFIVLLDANGNTLADDDDSGIDVDAQMIRTLAPGTYFVQATTFAPGVTGSYSLMVSVSGQPGGMCRPTAAVGIIIGATTNGTLANTDCYGYADGSLGDLYSFTRSATGTSTFTMSSTAVDSYLRLLNSAADVITEDDDSAGGNNARISRQLAAGSYFLVATAFPGQSGAYTITSSSSTAAALVRVSEEDLPPKVRASLRRAAGTTSLREFLKQKR